MGRGLGTKTIAKEEAHRLVGPCASGNGSRKCNSRKLTSDDLLPGFDLDVVNQKRTICVESDIAEAGILKHARVIP